MLEPKLRLNKLFWTGFVLFAIGSGPLLAIILAAQIGLLDDPNPNPVGFGMLAGLTFWPAVIMMLVGFIKARKLRDKNNSEL